jgi:hypothetical protein
MSNIAKRDEAGVARTVAQLRPEMLHALIQRRGLDACGELVAAATPEQLTTVLDLDLWRRASTGGSDRFDVERFGEWLEVLVGTGESLAARTVAGLDQGVVIAGLSRYLRVLDPGIFEPTAQSDNEAMDLRDVMCAASLEFEVGGYVVRARRGDTWDAVVSLLVALEEEHGDYFHAVMQGCRALSNSTPEIDGLDDLLLTPEQHLHDVNLERAGRLLQQGYVSTADARAFLDLGRRAQVSHSASGNAINPIVAEYFHAVTEFAASRAPAGLPEHAHESSSASAARDLLNEAGVIAERPRALLDGADSSAQGTLAQLRRLLAHVRETDQDKFLARSQEVAFLANTLMAGCTVQSRAFTAQEASDAAAAICNLGIEYWPGRWPRATSAVLPDSLLIDHDLIEAFEAGWSVLHQDVSMFAADRLIAILAGVHCDADCTLQLVALRRALAKHRDAHTPWRARDAAEILATLDTTAWIGVLGLLDECPVIPVALTAVVEGRTGSVSATNFDFISTAAQIGCIRDFMRKLPELLSN